MKKKNIFMGFTAIIIISIFALTGIFSCINIVDEDEDISIYNNNAERLVSENLPLSDIIKKIGEIFNNGLSDKINNDIYSNGSQLLKINSDIDKSKIKATVDDVNLLSEYLTGTSYFSIVPDSSYIYSASMPASDMSYKENDDITYAASLLSNKTKFINICNALISSDENYIFYRTDSLWTSEGAYCAYKRIIKKIGFTPTDYSEYNIIHMKSDYYGNLYNESGISTIQPDYIDRYKTTNKSKILNVKRSDNKEKNFDSIYFDEYLNVKGKELSYYLGEPCSIIDIDTNVNNNKRLLIVKDEYADEMIEFLSHHYSHITIVDPQIISNADTEYIFGNQYTDIIFLCGIENVKSGTFFKNFVSCLR